MEIGKMSTHAQILAHGARAADRAANLNFKCLTLYFVINFVKCRIERLIC